MPYQADQKFDIARPLTKRRALQELNKPKRKKQLVNTRRNMNYFAKITSGQGQSGWLAKRKVDSVRSIDAGALPYINALPYGH
jgi:hypothetical protein